MTSEELTAAVRHLQELPTDRQTGGMVELRVHPSFVRMLLSTTKGRALMIHLLATGQMRWAE